MELVSCGGKKGRDDVCVHYLPSLQGWLLQASLRGRENKRFLFTGINRADSLGSGKFGTPRERHSFALPREGPGTPARVWERMCLS